MLSINKSLAVIALALIVGCSDKDSVNSTTVNSIPQETSQAATQSSNPVAQKPQTSNSQVNSSQNQPATSGVDYLKPVNDTFVIPGKRIGLITADTTRADLVKIHGETNLKDDVVLRGEGTVSFPVTKVNPTTPGALTIFWTDESRNKISHVAGFGRQWKTLEGSLGPGTSMSGLREILGEFKLNGFAWDNGGFVYLEGTNLSKYKDKLALRLNPGENAFTKNQKQFAAVSGDSIFSSTNPNFKPLDVRVSNMIVTFDKNISPGMF
ncbi:MAG: hypothetical protein KI793_04750 [Rivularia sp. (in: Bacteria)]|nr:hypothetical protein [Rivularia sp. MS3]